MTDLKPCPPEDTDMVKVPKRFDDRERNKIINQCSTDLENIISGHDPEIHHLGNRVWDRLDKMALEIEQHFAKGRP